MKRVSLTVNVLIATLSVALTCRVNAVLKTIVWFAGICTKDGGVVSVAVEILAHHVSVLEL